MKYFENMLQPGFETGGSNPGHVSDGNVICRWFEGTYDDGDDVEDDDDDDDDDVKDFEKMTRKMMVMTLPMVTVMMVMKMLILVFLMGMSFPNDCLEHRTLLLSLLRF